MRRIQRRRRARCRLRCEVLLPGRRQTRAARVVTLSEGGLAVVGDLRADQGDPLRLRIHPGGGGAPVLVSAIVWNDAAADAAGGRSRLRRLGCVVSQPSPGFVALLDRLAPESRSAPDGGSESSAVPIARPRAAVPDSPEPDLPRSRELQPPPKPEPEERLPYFRVRMKQIGGPRTRILTLRARSATQAESQVFEDLARVVPDAGGWSVLHISKLAGR